MHELKTKNSPTFVATKLHGKMGYSVPRLLPPINRTQKPPSLVLTTFPLSSRSIVPFAFASSAYIDNYHVGSSSCLPWKEQHPSILQRRGYYYYRKKLCTRTTAGIVSSRTLRLCQENVKFEAVSIIVVQFIPFRRCTISRGRNSPCSSHNTQAIVVPSWSISGPCRVKNGIAECKNF